MEDYIDWKIQQRNPLKQLICTTQIYDGTILESICRKHQIITIKQAQQTIVDCSIINNGTINNGLGNIQQECLKCNNRSYKTITINRNSQAVKVLKRYTPEIDKRIQEIFKTAPSEKKPFSILTHPQDVFEMRVHRRFKTLICKNKVYLKERLISFNPRLTIYLNFSLIMIRIYSIVKFNGCYKKQQEADEQDLDENSKKQSIINKKKLKDYNKKSNNNESKK